MPSMAPNTPDDRPAKPHPGPHPSFIQVAKPYVFEQKLQECIAATGTSETKEDAARLQGVSWIDNVRKALQLPVRTYNTACVYYHKFRLVHPDSEYDYRDAAAAALFNACKIEDTLKKSRDILCAAWNMHRSASEHLSSDDPMFETPSKAVVGLERLMLEASGFDFRNRYPQKMLMKLVKSCNFDKDTVGVTAFRISLDLYRTFAPLKQTTQTMALACLELSAKLHGADLTVITSEHGFDYDKWATSRAEIMETLSDLLDLYTHHRNATVVGPSYPLDTFIAIRITLNQEAAAASLPRYTNWEEPSSPDTETNKQSSNGAAISARSNGAIITPKSISPQSPSQGPGTVGERAKDSTVRFMLDPKRARDEKERVSDYFKMIEVEEFVETDPRHPDGNNADRLAPRPYEQPSVLPGKKAKRSVWFKDTHSPQPHDSLRTRLWSPRQSELLTSEGASAMIQAVISSPTRLDESLESPYSPPSARAPRERRQELFLDPRNSHCEEHDALLAASGSQDPSLLAQNPNDVQIPVDHATAADTTVKPLLALRGVAEVGREQDESNMIKGRAGFPPVMNNNQSPSRKRKSPEFRRADDTGHERVEPHREHLQSSPKRRSRSRARRDRARDLFDSPLTRHRSPSRSSQTRSPAKYDPAAPSRMHGDTRDYRGPPGHRDYEAFYHDQRDERYNGYDRSDPTPYRSPPGWYRGEGTRRRGSPDYGDYGRRRYYTDEQARDRHGSEWYYGRWNDY